MIVKYGIVLLLIGSYSVFNYICNNSIIMHFLRVASNF
jgi:hypothetical protein